jgi:hypothetical protein
MTDSERLLATLNFEKIDKKAVVETFFPWTLSVDRWVKEGLPEEFCSKNLFPPCISFEQRFLDDRMTDPVYRYEQYLGYDKVKRMSFRIPFASFEEKILEETEEYILRQDVDGWQRKYMKEEGGMIHGVKAVVQNMEDWLVLKKKALEYLNLYCTDEQIEKVYGKYRKEHEEGKFSIRFRSSGFFWTPRELLGDEEEMYAFYDTPEMIHDMNQFILDTYLNYFEKIFKIIKPEIILFEEDLSGKNGPMISPSLFDEFIGSYYAKLTPALKKMGVKNIFVDTDGDFSMLIPNFMKAGIDGFVPMDVNAGMDIVKVRNDFPTLKFIGAYNKLEIAKGKEAIDAEFARLLPVIREGGYLPGCDHQVTPSTSFENYQYYIKRLHEVMQEN